MEKYYGIKWLTQVNQENVNKIILIELCFLRPTQHKIGHFGDIPQAKLFAWYEKKQNLTQQKHTFTNRKMYNNKINTKKVNPGLVACDDIPPGNGEGLVSALYKFVTYLLT